MFNITKLSSDSQSFLTQVTSSGRSRTPAAAIALARMISSGFSLPSQAVEDPVQYYRLQNEIEADKTISLINELCPVDTKFTQEMCRALYHARYNAAHPQPHVYSFREDTRVEDFFGITRAVSKETLTLIRTEGADLAFFANGFRRIVWEIQAEDREAAEHRLGSLAAV